jgi:hypothetical protein
MSKALYANTSVVTPEESLVSQIRADAAHEQDRLMGRS